MPEGHLGMLEGHISSRAQLERSQYETVSQSLYPQIFLKSACGEGVEPVNSQGHGCCVCELVQEQSGQVMAKIWAQTELIWLGSRQMLEKMSDFDLTLVTGTTVI